MTTGLMKNRADALAGIIGIEDGLAEVAARMRRVMGRPVDVLIEGESGTGKELFARALHAGDPRRSAGPFVALNCAAIPETLLEAELFGSEKGAFTGAASRTDGLFMQAEGGTLFLDEIGELPLMLQPKLLRVLQEKAVRRVGGRSEKPIDLRVVSATNADLVAATTAGHFRTDLYYRLAEFPIHVPPLRRRRGDIPALCSHLLTRFGALCGSSAPVLTPQALQRLRCHDWRRNNVRELSHVLKQALLLADGPTVGVEHLQLPALLGSSESVAPQEDMTAGMLKAMRQTDGNVAAAARLLGVSRSTLFDRLRRLGWKGREG